MTVCRCPATFILGIELSNGIVHHLRRIEKFRTLLMSCFSWSDGGLGLIWECRVLHLGLLYICSLLVLVGYSILYGLTSKEARWLGALTSVAVVILGNVLFWGVSFIVFSVYIFL
jgi:hypothetical protein